MRNLLQCLVRLFVVIVALSSIQGCVMCPCKPLDPATEYESADDYTAREVDIELISKSGGSDGGGRVTIRFSRLCDSYGYIVQELTLDDGDRLVECFRCGFGTLFDSHTWTSSPHARSMKVYLADVEGCDLDFGWGQLPQNMDGSIVTTVDKNFNADYQRTHETRGKITRASGRYAVWTITDKDGTITVGLPHERK